MQQRRVLRHHADIGPQTHLRDLRNILSVDQNATTTEVVQAQQQVGHRALAGA